MNVAMFVLALVFIVSTLSLTTAALVGMDSGSRSAETAGLLSLLSMTISGLSLSVLSIVNL